jgi:hypothetical protein
MVARQKTFWHSVGLFVQFDGFFQRMRQMPLRGHLFYLSIFLLFGYLAVAVWIVSIQPGEWVSR